MELTTIGGMIVGLVLIVGGIMTSGGSLMGFWDFASVLIVGGGVICSTMVAFPMRVLRTMPAIFRKVLKKDDIDYGEDIAFIIEIANIARRDGLMALEDELNGVEDPFYAKALKLVANGSDPELLKAIMQTEIVYMQERHARGQAVLEHMSSMSPAFGMIGTLIGLINMLTRLDAPSSLGPGMATALVTTFYGTVLANLFFTPMAKKLKVQSTQEILQKELILEGLLSIQDGESPEIIAEKLTAFVAHGLGEEQAEEGGAASTNAEAR